MDEKTIKILEIIQMFGPITGPDILALLEKENMEINIKTLYRIIDKLNYFFSKIGDGSMQIIGQKKIGYQLNHAYFSSGQLRFLTDAIFSSPLLTEDEKVHTSQLLDLFPNKTGQYKNDSFLHHLSLVSKAIENKKCIKFSYFDYDIIEQNNQLKIVKKYRLSGNDTQDTYLISPYEIMMNKGQYYVLSYCDKHPDNVTIFRLDRMDKIRTVKNAYFEALKEIIDYEEKKKQMINMFIGSEHQENVLIKFNKEIFKTIVDEFGTNIQLNKDVDGTYILELTNFAMSEGLINWIMMMGNQVEVLAPQSLKETIVGRLKILISKYQEGIK